MRVVLFESAVIAIVCVCVGVCVSLFGFVSFVLFAQWLACFARH